MKSIFYRTPYQQTLVYKVKATINESSAVFFNPKSSKLDKIRAGYALVKLVPVILDELPEPTVENTSQPSSHILIGIRDRFFRRLKLKSRAKFLRAFINLVIIINDTDFYRSFIGWWVWELRKSDWPALGPHQPDPHFFDSEKQAAGGKGK